MACWMAERVGESGSVLATDIDLSWFPGTVPGNVEMVRHELGRDPVPTGPFDLIHARLVLVHVPQRHQAVEDLIHALRPGGWLLLEDADPGLQPRTCIDEHGPREVLANKLRRGFRVLLEERGVDLAYGRTLPRTLREGGLVDVAADAFFPVGGEDCTLLERSTVEQVRDRLITAGLASPEEVDRHLANLDEGGLDVATSPLVSAWGRRAET